MPVTEDMILTALKSVNDPELRHNVVELGFIQEIDIVDGDVHISIQAHHAALPLRRHHRHPDARRRREIAGRRQGHG